jgi:hypothetical protein
MGKCNRSHRERGRRTDERPDSMSPISEKSDLMSPTFEPEKFDDLMDIYTDTDQVDPYTENYQWEDEDEDDI